jgi:hypothetical protein
MKKGVGSGSFSQMYGSGDPDPQQNVPDPQHCYKECCVFLAADVEYEYEEAVQECGYGRFHYILLLVCGWANASDAVEVCPVHA